MKKSIFKKVICSILTATTLCLSTIFPTLAADNEYMFKDISDIRETVIEIFNENYDELVEHIHSIRPGTDEYQDEYITYYTNCAPSSTAFQKILFDNGILVECQRFISPDHSFNFLRTRLASSPEKVTCIVIDTTYKQFLTQLYESNNLTFDDMAQDLPEVLIYEYGNKQEFLEQLKPIAHRFSENEFTKYTNHLFNAEHSNSYLSSDLQFLGYEGYNLTDFHKKYYTSYFIDQLRNHIIEYDTESSEAPVLCSTDGANTKAFEYDANGVYRCYLEQQEISSFSSGFTLTDSNGKIIYGAEESNLALTPIQNNRQNSQITLSSKGRNPIAINTQHLITSIMINIDMCAGKDNPVIYIFMVFRTNLYGDVDSDGTVDINDVTYLQKNIAGYPSATLSYDATDATDLLKCGASDIKNATEISMYLAKIKEFNNGNNIYYTAASALGSHATSGYTDYGYVDM